ncbi:hypothetical protein EUTSA_v10027832mg [Eutrema salsugineum]|uniref:DCD domain-containing protein n=1 Tax=Eutrema salsugineum TaxID=72664 RepID=V4LW45_EUTSA|nr:B2 protein [Eutrema salsugineum]ESQ46732.1 hypothetical protein EUTSA_v10027832mg [Eutrema salsugineum]
MENSSNQQSFWQFSDRLRVETLQNNLSLNDSIWSTNSVFRQRNEERRNLDIAADKNHIEYLNQNSSSKTYSDINSWKSSSKGFGPVGSKSISTVNLNPTDKFNDTWKFNSVDVNGDFNKGIYSSYDGFNVDLKNKGEDHHHHQQQQHQILLKAGGGGGKKNRKNQSHQKKNNNNNNNEDGLGLDKRFKTLPPAEALPRNETIGGYIFVCNNDTMEENLKRQLFGLPPRYRDSVRAITPGLPLFLYNYSTHQLHGIYQAASFGGTNIELSAFQDKKCPGESRFPAQVRAITRKVCLPLEEDSFRPILHHYDGPKFRLELTVPEVLSLLDIFAEQNP